MYLPMIGLISNSNFLLTSSIGVPISKLFINSTIFLISSTLTFSFIEIVLFSICPLSVTIIAITESSFIGITSTFLSRFSIVELPNTKEV